MISSSALAQFFQNIYHPEQYADYGPNGLQVEGAAHIQTIAFAVSAHEESIRAAIQHHAQALVVHHGILWNFHGVRPLVGPHGRRVALLMRHGINLFGYHLPMDGHALFGHAACIANELGLKELKPFGEYKGMPTGVQGRFETPVLPKELSAVLDRLFQRPVQVSSYDIKKPISSLGIITGGASDEVEHAANAGLCAYLTGEMKEHTYSLAKELGIHMFAGGHYATETFGVRRLMQLTAEKFPVQCVFLESENPA